MAKSSQHQQETSDSKRSGGGQAVVELCSACAGGLVFWSRQRFDIGAQLQIRVRRDALPAEMLASLPQGDEAWLSVSGYVVECPAVRRKDGAHGFKVSFLLESALTAPPVEPQPKAVQSLRYVQRRFAGMCRYGLN